MIDNASLWLTMAVTEFDIPRFFDIANAAGSERGRSSGVEHDLAKVGVEGSNPFARSNFFPSRCRSNAFGEFAGDEHFLDLARAVVDLEDAHVAIIFLDRIVVEEAVAAVDLDRG